MRKSVFTPEYQYLLQRLIKARHDAGLSQRELAEALKRERSFVARVEIGDRRLDVIELVYYLGPLVKDVPKFIGEVVKEAMRLKTDGDPPLLAREGRK